MPEASKRCILLFSGGLDSTVLLYDLLAKGIQVECLSFNYGQRHGKELHAAAEICNRLSVNRKLVSLSGGDWLDRVCSLTGDSSSLSGLSTVVPGRNLLMLSVAASWASAVGCGEVVYGANRSDREVYADCRSEFVLAAAEVLRVGYGLELTTPLLELGKSEVVVLGVRLGVPFELTWSCYVGGDYVCRYCGACITRANAFKEAGVTDPLVRYASGGYV